MEIEKQEKKYKLGKLDRQGNIIIMPSEKSIRLQTRSSRFTDIKKQYCKFCFHKKLLVDTTKVNKLKCGRCHKWQ